ncbi:MAG: adenylosuccinate lyase [Candidatus Marinimicrobia bacterium]|nr:adenylosuccinate lyase [Candidatus Neomarinimicrobiota bacterium]
MTEITNILAERYATAALTAIWSPTGKVRLERELWLAVLKAQRELGLPIAAEDIAAYEAVIDRIDLEDIARRERQTRHDVKARLEAFCALAGRELLHQGMTSRDLTENVEQLQVRRSLAAIRVKGGATLAAFAAVAATQRDLPLTARTHNVPAQMTTAGKRWAQFGAELLRALRRLDALLADYPLRGLKGAVGTQMDELTLFAGDAERVAALEDAVRRHLGFAECLDCVGQVYPRSLDFEVVAALYQLGAAPASFARTLRLMAGQELASEGFAKGQVGSSAMPHKVNSRSCERIDGLHVILRGHVTMAAALAGDQWNEGDVSCSVVRRVVLTDSFLALDGLFETTLTVLGQMQVSPAALAAECARYAPFLATTTVLMEAVRRGVGRETAHEAIKTHAVAVAQGLREGTLTENDLLERLAREPRLALARDTLQALFAQAQRDTGRAGPQVDAFVQAADAWLTDCPAARAYQPGAIL